VEARQTLIRTTCRYTAAQIVCHYSDSSAGLVLAVCIVVAVVEALALGPATLTRQAIRLWLLFVCLPAAAVLAVSRLGFLNTRLWLLLLLGPISFVIALVVVTILHNVLIASPHSPVAPADDAGGPSGKTPRGTGTP